MRHFFFLISMLLICKTICAQKELVNKPNLVFFELFGAAENGVGIGYERYFQMNELFRYSLRGGMSYDPEFTHVPLFLGNSFMFGKRHNIEMGFNYMRKYPQKYLVDNAEFNPNKEYAPDNYSVEEIVQQRDIFNLLLGYRYQNERSGFMFRMFMGTPIESNVKFIVGPHLGISLGLSF